jgi:hypothetical protein
MFRRALLTFLVAAVATLGSFDGPLAAQDTLQITSVSLQQGLSSPVLNSGLTKEGPDALVGQPSSADDNPDQPIFRTILVNWVQTAPRAKLLLQRERAGPSYWPTADARAPPTV